MRKSINPQQGFKNRHHASTQRRTRESMACAVTAVNAHRYHAANLPSSLADAIAAPSHCTANSTRILFKTARSGARLTAFSPATTNTAGGQEPCGVVVSGFRRVTQGRQGCVLLTTMLSFRRKIAAYLAESLHAGASANDAYVSCITPCRNNEPLQFC